MKDKPKRLTPKQAVEFIDSQDNLRLIESRHHFADGTWVMTLWPGGHWTFVSSPQVKAEA